MTEIEEFHSIFADLSKDYDRAIAVGDHKKANLAHSSISALVERLEPSVRNSLLIPLLKSGDEVVRLWTAALVLKYDLSDAAKKVLLEITRSGSIHGLTAKAILDLQSK